ncbi:uncharacterized protein IL334_002850 [Kwoniella shivajii]|uniref:Uncharacterized protein n=1 Tax=Kwoniella shivajii TaxID=564305 RepID=A0ABZ1CXL1_9TREE|nr:hypothetical protein IL334_002850 [Kwoniella shivajii]
MSFPSSAAQRCFRCSRFVQASSSSIATRLISSSTRLSNSSKTGSEAGEINTWFVDSSPRSSPPSRPTPEASSSTDQSYYNTPALPESTPSILHPLHKFLISPETEASEVLFGHTVRFFDTRMLARQLDKLGQGELVKGEDGLRGGYYDWVIVAQVKGRGRGIVARGDGVLRRWLLKNPLHPSIPITTIEYPKTPRISPDSDWSIIPLNLGEDETRACVNLVSEEGRHRWRLEDMWGGVSH